MGYGKFKIETNSSTINLTKYLGVGKDWPETEVPTLSDVLRKGLHIEANLLLSDDIDK